MPPDKNVPPLDSFEHEHNVAERHVPGFDDRLSGVLNPPKGQDRIKREQYATTTIRPGAPNERKSGIEVNKGSAIPSEQFKTVNHHNFG
jgi:hypothetical protein